jgi:hypothetical protein
MTRSEDDLVEIMPAGDGVLYLSAEAMRALAVMMHVFDDDRHHALAPVLRPYLRVLDRKLTGAPRR